MYLTLLGYYNKISTSILHCQGTLTEYLRVSYTARVLSPNIYIYLTLLDHCNRISTCILHSKVFNYCKQIITCILHCQGIELNIYMSYVTPLGYYNRISTYLTLPGYCNRIFACIVHCKGIITVYLQRLCIGISYETGQQTSEKLTVSEN